MHIDIKDSIISVKFSHIKILQKGDLKMNNQAMFSIDIMAMNDRVTGSCNLFVVNYPDRTKTNFILECGRYQEPEEMRLNDSFDFNPCNISFAVITHNHVDHNGRISQLMHEGFCGKIYTSEATALLMPLALDDNYKIMSLNCKKASKKLVYSINDLERSKQLIQSIKYSTRYKVDEHITITLIGNGHLVGASMVLIEVSFENEEPINILFTGDYKKENMLFDVNKIPNWVKALPIIIVQEATYGNFKASDKHDCYRDNIIEGVKKDNVIALTAFSLGRTEEILYILKQLKDQSKISKNTPIILDGGLAQGYIHLRRKNEDVFNYREDIMPSCLTFVGGETREAIIRNNESKIIVTSAGMGDNGPAQLYLPALVSKKNALIQFPGYTAKNTLGRRLLESKVAETIMINGILRVRNAKIDDTTGLSGHAKPDELVELLREFPNLKLVLVCHGEPEAKTRYVQKVKSEIRVKDVEVLSRANFFRVGAFGLIKVVNSKFNTRS